MFKWVTPSLAVVQNEIWPAMFLQGEAELAVAWLQASTQNTAFVDSDETAADVLRLIGLSEDEVADRLHFANTGRIL